MRQRFALVSQCRPHALRLVEATEEMWREVRAETMAAAVPVGDMVAVAMAAVAMEVEKAAVVTAVASVAAMVCRQLAGPH